MTLDLNSLRRDADILEDIEKATLRMVAQAIYDFRQDAQEFFAHEPDLAADIGEDITREALDRLGASVLPVRLFGKTIRKRGMCFIWSIRQGKRFSWTQRQKRQRARVAQRSKPRRPLCEYVKGAGARSWTRRAACRQS